MLIKLERIASSAFFSVALALLLSACQSLSVVNQDQESSIDPSDAVLHDSFTLRQVHRSVLLRYGERTCTYMISNNNKMLSSPINEARSIMIIPFHDKYALVSSNGEHSSSAVMGSDGKVYDYNAWNTYAPTEGPFTPETAYQVSKNEIKMANKVMNPLTETNPHVVNEMSVELPFFERQVDVPGQIVAHVYTADDHAVWANYRFLGFSSYLGKDVAIIDLERKIPSIGNKVIIVGFNVIDITTAMPLLSVFKAGTETHLRQISCDK